MYNNRFYNISDTDIQNSINDYQLYANNERKKKQEKLKDDIDKLSLKNLFRKFNLGDILQKQNQMDTEIIEDSPDTIIQNEDENDDYFEENENYQEDDM